MRKISLLLGVAFLFSLEMFAQIPATALQLSYDDAGNRIKREVITLGGPSARFTDTTEVYSQEDISVYPNPTRGEINIKILGSDDDISRMIEIYSSEGKLVLKEPLLSTSKKINLSNEKNGNYYLNIYGNGKRTSWNIIKTE